MTDIQYADDEYSRILVCGSRDFNDFYIMGRTLDGFMAQAQKEHRKLMLIHGAAKGADSLAQTWANYQVNLTVLSYPAEWRKWGNKAGIMRNLKMLDEARPDVVLAFVNKKLDESRGTRHMVRIARQANVLVYVIRSYL